MYEDGQKFTVNRDVVWKNAHCTWRLDLNDDESYRLMIERYTHPELQDEMTITLTNRNGTSVVITNSAMNRS